MEHPIAHAFFFLVLLLESIFHPALSQNSTCNGTLPGDLEVAGTIYAGTLFPLTSTGTLTIGSTTSQTNVNGAIFLEVEGVVPTFDVDIITATNFARFGILAVDTTATIDGNMTANGIQFHGGSVMAFFDEGTFDVDATTGVYPTTKGVFLWQRFGNEVTLVTQAVSSNCTGSAAIFFPFTETRIKPSRSVSAQFILQPNTLGATTGFMEVALLSTYGMSVFWLNTTTNIISFPGAGVCGWQSSIFIKYNVL